MNGKSLFSAFVLKKLKATHVLIFVLLNLFLWAFHFFLFRPTSIDMYEMRSNPFFNAIFSLRDFFPGSFYLEHRFRRFSLIVVLANLTALQWMGFDFIHKPTACIKEWVDGQNQKPSILFLFCFAIAMIAPMGSVLYFIFNHRIVIPYMDTWVILGPIEKYFLGTMTFNDLWEWHGAGFHRNFFPRLIEIIVADRFHWQFIYIHLFTAFLALLSFLLIAFRFMKMQKKIFTLTTMIALLLVSAVVFSARLGKTWTWDQGVVSYLSIFPVVWACFLMTTKSSLSWQRMFFAFCLGVISNASFTAGVAFWPVGFMLICFADNTATVKKIMAGIWFICAVIFLKVYFTGYYGIDSENTHLLSFLFNKKSYFIYFCTYLGGVFPSILIAKVFGLVGFVYFCYAFFFKVIAGRKKDNDTRFFSALGIFAILAGLLIAVGRYKGGNGGALSFNYANYSNLFFISIVGLMAIQIKESSFKPKTELRVLWGMLMLTFLVYSFSFISAADLIHESKTINRYKDQLLSGENLSSLSNVSQVPQHLARWLAILKKRNLNIFYTDQT